MKSEHYVRSNVKVVFDDVSQAYPRARLMFKVKGFLFNKWVEVNDCFFTDCYGRMQTAEQMVKRLVSEGQRGKYLKKRRRKLAYEMKGL